MSTGWNQDFIMNSNVCCNTECLLPHTELKIKDFLQFISTKFFFKEFNVIIEIKQTNYSTVNLWIYYIKVLNCMWLYILGLS